MRRFLPIITFSLFALSSPAAEPDLAHPGNLAAQLPRVHLPVFRCDDLPLPAVLEKFRAEFLKNKPSSDETPLHIAVDILLSDPKTASPLTVSLKNQSAKQVLDDLVAVIGCRYEIVGDWIILRPIIETSGSSSEQASL